MKKFLLILFTLVFITSVASAELYPNVGWVCKLDHEHDIFILEDFGGNLYVYEGIEDWFLDDIAAMLMDDNGTESIYDDVIVELRYAGYMEE